MMYKDNKVIINVMVTDEKAIEQVVKALIEHSGDGVVVNVKSTMSVDVVDKLTDNVVSRIRAKGYKV
jgi:3-hydroxyisobutyrate dehydrogenase-like beta-hydroxyacid dehydrogenase